MSAISIASHLLDLSNIVSYIHLTNRRPSYMYACMIVKRNTERNLMELRIIFFYIFIVFLGLSSCLFNWWAVIFYQVVSWNKTARVLSFSFTYFIILVFTTLGFCSIGDFPLLLQCVLLSFIFRNNVFDSVTLDFFPLHFFSFSCVYLPRLLYPLRFFLFHFFTSRLSLDTCEYQLIFISFCPIRQIFFFLITFSYYAQLLPFYKCELDLFLHQELLSKSSDFS